MLHHKRKILLCTRLYWRKHPQVSLGEKSYYSDYTKNYITLAKFFSLLFLTFIQSGKMEMDQNNWASEQLISQQLELSSQRSVADCWYMII